jgi:uncharacterized protein (TIGR01777 family)
MRILVTGATGFIGYQLVKELVGKGNELVVVSRDPDRARGRFARLLMETGTQKLHFYGWDSLHGPPPAIAINEIDAVVHLAGEPLGEARWTAEQKKRIRDSRLLGTRHLVQGLASIQAKVLISSSAIGFYGDRGDEKLDEASSAGKGFLSDVCRDWEREALEAENIEGLRVVRLRTGMVLGTTGGALARVLPIFRWGAGGTLGSGKQWMSWIHERDMVGLILWALDHPEVHGAVNGVAPTPITNREFVQTLAQALRRPAVVPAPATALKWALGEMSDLVLQSQRVLPKRALEKGFQFQFQDLEPAIRDLTKR